ncbi:S9 family peptidase [Solibacillus sp. CAU 1738]|uniref:S9 family peptidase n=1 Tax=Solibacillus sp. CAU 1738 TaxID=3140363 RepID=UPI0032600BFE
MTTYLTKEHLYKLQSVTNPVLSPDDTEAVFIRTLIDEEDNKYYAHLFHVALQDKEVTQWTFGKERISSPKWSPNGKQIAFLSNRDEKNQLFVINKNGGEAKKIANFPYGVNSFVWSPCGDKLWVTANLKNDKTFADKIEKDDKKLPEAYVVDQLKYKMDGVGGDGLRQQGISSHIAQVTLDGDITQFTEGNHFHSLSGISRDGKTLIVSVNRTEIQDFEFRQSLYLVDVETKKETVLVDQNGHYGGATYSIDNRYVAYVGSDASYKNATHSNIYVYDTETGETTELTAGIDAPVGDYAVADVQQGVSVPSVVWTDTNALYFQLSTMGDVRLYYATLDGAIYPASPEGEHVYGYTVAKSGNEALITVSNMTFPGELFHYDITTGERTQLTKFNDAFLEDVTLSTPEPIVYKGAKDWDVYGWLMKPANYVEGEKYPLIVEVHGGPHTMYANSFFHEMQLLAAQGYGVLFVNPRGSHGYSQAFVDAVRGDYGGGDYEDIMAGLDYALANYSWIDENRLGLTGGSYGGFMTNWAVGHTNRFKAAVTQRSISNWISFFGVSDIGYYFTDWQIGTDMMDVETLWKHSPLKYAKNVETPLLILHSEKDFRCPIEQAEQLYVTLKTMGKEVGFVRFPGSDHNLSRTGTPNLRLQRLDQIVSWFKKYI